MAAPANPGRINSYLRVLSTGLPEKSDPTSKEITPEDFPELLVSAVGRDNLMRAVRRDEQRTVDRDHFDDDCSFGLLDFPETGSLIGRDAQGRVYFSFLVSNPGYRNINIEREEYRKKCNICIDDAYEIQPITIYQVEDVERGISPNDVLFRFKERYLGPPGFSYRDNIPTNDPRLFGPHCFRESLTRERYQAIQEIFEGRHPDLRMVVKFNKPKPAADEKPLDAQSKV